MGCKDLLVATDHKPLVKILGDGNLDNISNPQLFNIKERTLRYSYKIKHVHEAGHHAPDAFSRRRHWPSYPSFINNLLDDCCHRWLIPGLLCYICTSWSLGQLFHQCLVWRSQYKEGHNYCKGARCSNGRSRVHGPAAIMSARFSNWSECGER